MTVHGGKIQIFILAMKQEKKINSYFEEFVQFQSFKFLVLKKSTFYFFKVGFLSGYHMKKKKKKTEIKISEVHEIPVAHC